MEQTNSSNLKPTTANHQMSDMTMASETSLPYKA